MSRSPKARLFPLAVGTAVVATIVGLALLVLETHAGPSFPNVALDRSRPRPQGDFYRGAYANIETANPFTTTEATAIGYVIRFTHDPLFDEDPDDGSLRPAIAESKEVSEDGSTIVFRLRDGVRFSDGTPLTMADVEFTVAVAKSDGLGSENSMTGALRMIESLEPLDERRFAVRIERRYTGLVRLATQFRVVQRRFFIDAVAEAARRVGRDAPDDPSSAEFVRLLAEVKLPGPGTGPYRIAERDNGRPDWVPQSHLNLVQNQHCWQRTERPTAWNLAGIHLRFIEDPTAKFTALRNEEIDWYYAAEDLAAIQRREPDIAERYELHTYALRSRGPFHVVWNCREGRATHDRRVRLALTMLFDRDAIVRDLLNGQATAPVSWFLPGTPEYPADLPPWPTAVDRAKQLLADAGYPDGLSIEILSVRTPELSRRILELARGAFLAAGVELETPTMPYNAMTDRRDKGEFDGLIEGIQHSGPIDPFDEFHSSVNVAGYANPQMDAVLERLRHELDPARHLAVCREFNELFWQEVPVTLLAIPRIQVLLHRRFKDVRVGWLGLYPEAWWVEPRDQIVRQR